MNNLNEKINKIVKYLLIGDAIFLGITLFIYIFVQGWGIYITLLVALGILVLIIFFHAFRLLFGYIKEGIDIIRFKRKEKTFYKHKKDK